MNRFKEVSLSAFFKGEKKRKLDLIDQDFEDEEGVWVLIFGTYGLLYWPGIFCKKTQKANLLNGDLLRDSFGVLSVVSLSTFDCDIFSNKIPSHLQSAWDSAYLEASHNTKNDLVMKHIFGKENETHVDQIEADNLKIAPKLSKSTKSFLAKSLISLKKSGIGFDENKEMSFLEETMANVLQKDKILGVNGPVEFSYELFTSYNKGNPNLVLSPLFALRNLHFDQISEMNYQEALSIIFSYLIGISNGLITTTGNDKEDALANQSRLSRYFTTKYFKPDKILTRVNFLSDFDWRFFFGEWKPVEIDTIYEHPDFKKVVLLMRGSLTELLFELFERKLLGSDTELDVFGSLSAGTKICFLRLFLIPKVDNKQCFSYSYRLYNSVWYDFTTPDGISKVTSILLQIGRRCLNYQFSSQPLSLVEKISDTPTSSKSVFHPSLPDLQFSNLVSDRFASLDLLVFSSYNDALDVFSKLLSYQLVPEEVIQKSSVKEYAENIFKREQNRTCLFLKGNAKTMGYPLHVLLRGLNCVDPINEIELVFKLRNNTNRVVRHLIKISIRTVEQLNSMQFNNDNDYDDENDDEHGDEDDDNNNDNDGNDGDNDNNKNNDVIMLSSDIHNLSIGSNYNIELVNQKTMLGTMKYNNKESYFKITNKKFENIQIMKFIEWLKNPNICEIFFYGPVNDLLFITIQEKLLNYDELGDTLQNLKIIENLNLIIGTIILKSFIGCLRALEFLHQHRIVHCDVSVHNIMFRMKNETDFDAVLIDFNNSKFLNQSSIVNYKEEYTPSDPELRFTNLHDLYALSIVIKKLLSHYSKVKEDVISDIHFVQFDVLPLSNIIKKMNNLQYSNATDVLNELSHVCTLSY